MRFWVTLLAMLAVTSALAGGTQISYPSSGGSGTFDGSIADGQVCVGGGVNEITGSNSFTWVDGLCTIDGELLVLQSDGVSPLLSINQTDPGADPTVKMLLHMDGANNSTTFTDTAGFQTVTRSGSAVISTTQSKFGGASTHIPGGSSYLSITDNADLEFGSGNFTISFWLFPTTTGRQAIMHWNDGGDYSFGIDFHQNGTRNISLWASSTGSSWNMLNADGGGNAIGLVSVPLNTWTHIAVVRNGNNWRSYINGVMDLNVTATGTIIDKSAAKLIGKWGPGVVGNFDGYIDEVLITKGTALYTSDFTPPAAPYSLSATAIDKVGVRTDDPRHALDVAGSFGTAVVSTSGDITLDDTRSVILVSASGAARTVTLPSAVSIPGRWYLVKKTDASANTVTIDGDGSETIDGATTLVLDTQYESTIIISNGSGWSAF
jgi:hypothetical protein